MIYREFVPNNMSQDSTNATTLNFHQRRKNFTLFFAMIHCNRISGTKGDKELETRFFEIYWWFEVKLKYRDIVSFTWTHPVLYLYLWQRLQTWSTLHLNRGETMVIVIILVKNGLKRQWKIQKYKGCNLIGPTATL